MVRVGKGIVMKLSNYVLLVGYFFSISAFSADLTKVLGLYTGVDQDGNKCTVNLVKDNTETLQILGIDENDPQHKATPDGDLIWVREGINKELTTAINNGNASAEVFNVDEVMSRDSNVTFDPQNNELMTNVSTTFKVSKFGSHAPMSCSKLVKKPS